MNDISQADSNMEAFERAKAAAHAPRDSASGGAKIIAIVLMAISSIGVIVAGYIFDGGFGAFIGLVLAVGIVGIGGTAVWMAEHSHKKETAARRAAAAEQLRHKQTVQQQGTAE